MKYTPNTSKHLEKSNESKKGNYHGWFLEGFSTLRTLLYHWVKTNSLILLNAGSLMGTTGITLVLGFAYWWLAARYFSPEAVGLASASISAMTLIATSSILGLGTLLIGELPRQPGREGPLISAALILVGGVGGCLGIVFALIAPFVSADFQTLRASIEDIVLFAAGVSLTAITLVLDQAFIGLLRGELQLGGIVGNQSLPKARRQCHSS